MRYLCLKSVLASFALVASPELHAQHPTLSAAVRSFAVDCDAGATIGKALGGAKPGDTVLVSGTCRESVFVQSEQARITGGDDAIHLSGPAHAVIDGNVIVQNKGRGVLIDKGSIVQMVNNTITGNAGVGIQVTEQSYARIGFLIPPDSIPRSNTIENNGGGGIRIEIGGYVDGPLGTLTGTQGAKQFDGTCIDRVTAW